MRKGLKIKCRRRREKEEVEKERDNCRIVFLILGDSTASEFYVRTFQNTLFHLHRLCTPSVNSLKTTPLLPKPDFFLKKWSYCFLTPDKHRPFSFFKKQVSLNCDKFRGSTCCRRLSAEWTSVWGSFHTITQSVPNNLSYLNTIDWLIDRTKAVTLGVKQLGLLRSTFCSRWRGS